MNIPAAMALALLLGSGAAWAREAPAPQKSVGQKFVPHPGASRHDDGIVMAVDAAKGRLSLKDELGRVRKFSVRRARIDSVEGKVISLADIVVGDQVAVSYNYSIRGKDVIEVLRLRRAMKP